MRAVVPPGTSPAASSHVQRGSRAAHVTAKATFDLLAFRRCPWSGPSGVWGAARTQGLVRDRRDPSAQPCQQRPSYKPVVKSSGAQRESDGVVVLLSGVQQRGRREGPRLRSRRRREVTREGMTGTARSNYPEGSICVPVEKVRRLQNRLWAAAKQSEGRRFHALYDRIYRSDVLWEAWSGSEPIVAPPGSIE